MTNISPTTVFGAIGNTSAAIAGLITVTAPNQYIPVVLFLGALAMVAKQAQAIVTPDKVLDPTWVAPIDAKTKEVL